MKKNTLKAFTLIELLVVIAIIAILALWIGNMNFASISDKQSLDRWVSKIVSIIEQMRNDALSWKSADNTGFVPEFRTIVILKDFLPEFETLYKDSSWTDKKVTYSSSVLHWVSILKTTCSKLDWSSAQTVTGISTIIYNGADTSFILLGWCSPIQQFPLLTITVWYKSLSKNIYINKINWLISVED